MRRASSTRPYDGWVAALGAFVQQLLMLSDARLAEWREQLRAGLGNIAAALVDIVPVELMMEKIGRLDPSERALIEFASCVGDEFDVDLLAELGRRERAVLERSVYALSDAGLIATSPNGFRFVHGRIREAAQSLLTEAARTQVHYDIARLLLARTPPPEQAERAFAILEHLNRGLPHLSEDLRLTAVGLNFSAGKRALASGDAATAESYFAVARLLMREDDWASERALGFELLLQSAYSALLRRDFEGALAFLRDLDARAPSILESTHIEIKRIQVFALTKHPEECTRYVLEVLRRHRIRWPLHPSALRARLALYRVLWKLRKGIPNELLHPAKHVDPRWLAPILITGVSSGVMTRVDARLVVLMACWIMDSNLRRGYVARPHFSLFGLAGLVHHVLGDARQAQRITQFTVDWLEKKPDPAYRPRKMQLHVFLRPWWTRRRQAFAPMDRVAEDMREMGDLEYAYYSRFLKIACCGLAGENVQKTDALLGELADEVRRTGNHYPDPERCHAAYRFLVGGSDADLDRTLAESDAWIAANGGSTGVYIRTFWLLVLCVRGRYATALQQSELSWRRLFQVVPYVHIADHTFLRGLASAALATDALGAARRRHLREVAASLKRLRHWAKHGPDFLHMASFLEAEQAHLRGRPERARSLYTQAAQRAREQEYPHHAALACERHARLLATLRRETEVAGALHDSIALYSQWGSQLKVDALAQQSQVLFGS
jgi:hypothetical protein